MPEKIKISNAPVSMHLTYHCLIIIINNKCLSHNKCLRGILQLVTSLTTKKYALASVLNSYHLPPVHRFKLSQKM